MNSPDGHAGFESDFVQNCGQRVSALLVVRRNFDLNASYGHVSEGLSKVTGYVPMQKVPANAL